MEASKQVEMAATIAVFVLRTSMPGLTEADAVNLLSNRFLQAATRGASHSSVAAGSRGPTASTGQRSLPVVAVPPQAAGRALPLDAAAVSRLRRLPKDVKGGRLIQAAKDGVVCEIQALLAAGADLWATDKVFRRTALHFAAAMGHLEATRCLVEAGVPLECKDRDGATALFLAASKGHADVVKLLVASSANPSASDGCTYPSLIAKRYGHAEVVAVLMDAGVRM